MAKPHDQFAKRWRITSVIGWDEADLDLLGPAFIEFDRNGTGSLQILAIEAGIDWRMRSETDDEAIEWSWIGDDDGTETSGRGQAQLAENGLVGTLFIHLGDDLQFRASPGELRPPKTAKDRRSNSALHRTSSRALLCRKYANISRAARSR